jgi:parallel beta-helix repeat protein
MNESYARFLHSRSVLDQDVLVQALKEAQASGQTLNQILIERKLLAADRAVLYWTYFQDSLQTLDGGPSEAPKGRELPADKGPSGSDSPSPLDKYRILGEINRGGMGVIYRARHRETNDDVIIKTPLKGKKPGSTILERFDREAQTLALLNHPNIVKISDYGRFDDQPFFVMEYIRGENLDDIITTKLTKNKELPDGKWLAKVFSKLADALDHCHANGVIHRDLKPSNVIIEYKTNRPVLVDFGLVKQDIEKLAEKISDMSDKQLTKTGEVIGTPAFMAPEQLNPRGYGEVSSASDIWSFGATLFFAMTGRLPYEVRGLVQLFGAMASGPPRTAISISPNVHIWLSTLCARCMELESAKRLSAKQVSRILRERRKARFSLTGNQTKLVAATMLVLVLSFVLYLAGFRDSTNPILLLDVQAKKTRFDKFNLSGKIDDSSPKAIIVKRKNQRKRYKVDSSGAFRIPQRLNEGRNKFSLIAIDESGHTSAIKELVIHRDTTPPKLKFTNFTKKTYLETLILEGKLSEAPCTMIVDKTTYRVSGREFKIPLKLKFGKNIFQLSIKDSIGNSTNESFSIQRSPFVVVGSIRKLTAQPSATYGDLQTAIEKAPSACRILVGEGRYVISKTLNRDVEIVGQGARDKIVIEGAEKGTVFDIDTKNVLLKNLTLLTRKSDLISNTISIKSGHTTIEECYISNRAGTGIAVIGGLDTKREKRKASSLLTMRNSVVAKCSQKGIYILQGSVAKLYACTIRDNTDTGVHLITSSVCSLKNCIVENNKIGVMVTNKSQARIEQTQILKNRSSGLYVEERGSVLEIIKGQIKNNQIGVFAFAEAVCNLDTVIIEKNNSIGLFAKGKATVEASNCTFQMNRSSGVLGVGSRTIVKIFNSKILNNGSPRLPAPGIHAKIKAKMIIDNCQIEGNQGAGLNAQSKGLIQHNKCVFRKNWGGRSKKRSGGVIIGQ